MSRPDLACYVTNPGVEGQLPTDLARLTIEHQFHGGPAPAGYQPERHERARVAPVAALGPSESVSYPAIDESIDARYVNRRPRGRLPGMGDQPAPPMDTRAQREAAADAADLHAIDTRAAEARKLARHAVDRTFREEHGIKPGHGRSADTPSRSPAKRAEQWLRAKARRSGWIVPTPAEARSLKRLGIDAVDLGADPGPDDL